MSGGGSAPADTSLPRMKSNDRDRTVIRRLVRPVTVGGLAGVALAACTGGGATPAEPSVPTAVSSTSTASVASVATTAPDVSAIPAKIDEAYLNAVLAALDEVDGQATRIIKAAKNVPVETTDLLNSIYSDKEALIQSKSRIDALVRDPQLAGLLRAWQPTDIGSADHQRVALVRLARCQARPLARECRSRTCNNRVRRPQTARPRKGSAQDEPNALDDLMGRPSPRWLRATESVSGPMRPRQAVLAAVMIDWIGGSAAYGNALPRPSPAGVGPLRVWRREWDSNPR